MEIIENASTLWRGYDKHFHFLDLMAIFILVIILLKGIPDKYRPHNIYSQIIIVCKQSHGNKKSVFAPSLICVEQSEEDLTTNDHCGLSADQFPRMFQLPRNNL